jgi:hypothetical protein
VYLACSDSVLRCLRLEPGANGPEQEHQAGGLEAVQEQPAGRHCLLQVAACGPGAVVTGSTAGLLVAWAVGPGADDLLRPLAELSVHQSGVNCLAVRPDGAQGAHLLLTGGDDGALVLSRLVLAGGGAELAQVCAAAEG